MRSMFRYLFTILLCVACGDLTPTPIVMWHGMGDTCCLPFSLGAISNLIKSNIEGVYVKSLKIGSCFVEDYKSGFFMNPNKQVEYVCKQLKADAQLSNGYNAIGFSQGSQFLRAVAQRCPQPRMKTLISIGGQHQGIFGLPQCPSISKETCERIRKLLTSAAYDKWVQEKLVQASYWHDPLNEERYKRYNIFLADINNELTINTTYIENLQNLERFVMVKFLNDTIVQPKDSEWFEFYSPGQDIVITPLKKSEIYLKDRLGLKQMDSQGKLIFLACEGNHLHMSSDWFIQHIIPLLKNKNSTYNGRS